MSFISNNKFNDNYLNKISAKFINYNMENYLSGDVRLNNDISPIDSNERANDFLINLQNLMDLYGVIKVDIAIDIYKYNDIIKKNLK